MSCTSSDKDVLNAKHGEGDPTLVIDYGPYMNWGSWNHNTTRITSLIDAFLKAGEVVQLRHDAKETTWGEHGDVTVSTPDGTVLGTVAKAQHNSNYHARQSLLARLAQEVLTSLKKQGTNAKSSKQGQEEEQEKAAPKAEQPSTQGVLLRSSSTESSG